MVLNHGLQPLRTMVLKIPALAPGYRKNIEVVAGRISGPWFWAGVQTMVPDHGFTRVGTMHGQAIMPPLAKDVGWQNIPKSKTSQGWRLGSHFGRTLRELFLRRLPEGNSWNF